MNNEVTGVLYIANQPLKQMKTIIENPNQTCICF